MSDLTRGDYIAKNRELRRQNRVLSETMFGYIARMNQLEQIGERMWEQIDNYPWGSEGCYDTLHDWRDISPGRIPTWTRTGDINPDLPDE